MIGILIMVPCRTDSRQSGVVHNYHHRGIRILWDHSSEKPWSPTRMTHMWETIWELKMIFQGGWTSFPIIYHRSPPVKHSGASALEKFFPASCGIFCLWVLPVLADETMEHFKCRPFMGWWMMSSPFHVAFDQCFSHSKAATGWRKGPNNAGLHSGFNHGRG